MSLNEVECIASFSRASHSRCLRLITCYVRTVDVIIRPFSLRNRCHPGDDPTHQKTSCRVIVEEVCQKGHISKRRCEDPKGRPCRPCDRERKAIEEENARNAETQHRREEEREAAVTRLVKARREAALQRKELAHELELARLEKETRRTQIDADVTKSTKESVRARAVRLTETRPSSTETSPTANQGNEGKCPPRKGPPKQDETRHKASAELKPPPHPTTTALSKPDGASERGKNALPPGLQASTLFQIAQAAREGDARGIVDALQAVPIEAREKTSSGRCWRSGRRLVPSRPWGRGSLCPNA